jgi:hypothetical protein
MSYNSMVESKMKKAAESNSERFGGVRYILSISLRISCSCFHLMAQANTVKCGEQSFNLIFLTRNS